MGTLQPHSSSFEWMLVAKGDFEHFVRTGTHLTSAYQQIACAQNVYFAPGTVIDWTRIRDILKSIGAGLPTVSQVEPLVDQIERGPGSLGLYKYSVEGDVWHLRNQTAPDWTNAFGRTAWRLVAYTGQRWSVIHDVTSVRDALAAFAFINGHHTLAQAESALAGNREGTTVLRSLIAHRLVVARPAVPVDLGRIPEFLFLGHSGLLVRSGEDMLAIDPVVIPNTRLLASQDLPVDAILDRARAVLISHSHWDHFHYPNLARLRRDMRMIVPRVERPNLSNPPMGAYLRELGFTQVEERSPWEVIELGEITLTLADFIGEPFGLDSRLDGLTYHVRFGNHSLYGTVDTCHDETGNMEHVIDRVSGLGPLDYFLFCSSGLRHTPPYCAAIFRHFSNELTRRPELVRVHPEHADATRWAKRLKPRALIPYAEFLFQGIPSPHLPMSGVLDGKNVGLAGIPANLAAWESGLHKMAHDLDLPIQLLHPMQGLIA